MNASHTTYPMPDTDCPRWCLEDHRPSWEQWVATAFDTRPIPASGGGFLTGPGTPLDVWLSRWSPYHRAVVATVDLDCTARVEIVRAEADTTGIYLDYSGDGDLTAEQTRRLAAALLNAADELDRITL